MRLPLLAAVTTAAGLAACAPIAPYPYGYTAVGTAPAAAPYYDYGPGQYYPGYAAPYAAPYAEPYVTPGPTIVIGGERGYRNDERYRYERDRGYRGPPPGREGGRPPPGRQEFGGGGRPGPAQVAPPQIRSPAPPQAPAQGPSPGPGGHSPSYNPANPGAQGERG